MFWFLEGEGRRGRGGKCSVPPQDSVRFQRHRAFALARRNGTRSGGSAREKPRQVPASSKGSFWNLTLSWGGRLHFHEKSGKLNCRLSLYQLLSAVQERENRVLFRYLQCACDRLYGIKLNIEIMRKNSGLENGGFYERSKDWGDC